SPVPPNAQGTQGSLQVFGQHVAGDVGHPGPQRLAGLGDQHEHPPQPPPELDRLVVLGALLRRTGAEPLRRAGRGPPLLPQRTTPILNDSAGGAADVAVWRLAAVVSHLAPVVVGDGRRSPPAPFRAACRWMIAARPKMAGTMCWGGWCGRHRL